MHHPGRLCDRRCRPDVAAGRPARHRQGGRAQAREGAARDVPAYPDQHPPHTQALPPDLLPHRRLRPLRPRAGQGRRFLVGKDGSRAGSSRRRSEAPAASDESGRGFPAIFVCASRRRDDRRAAPSSRRILRPAQGAPAARAAGGAVRLAAPASRARSERTAAGQSRRPVSGSGRRRPPRNRIRRRRAPDRAGAGEPAHRLHRLRALRQRHGEGAGGD